MTNKEFTVGYNLLKSHRATLSKQQYKTFLGQLKNGNYDGMIKGLEKVKKRTQPQ